MTAPLGDTAEHRLRTILDEELAAIGYLDTCLADDTFSKTLERIMWRAYYAGHVDSAVMLQDQGLTVLLYPELQGYDGDDPLLPPTPPPPPLRDE